MRHIQVAATLKGTNDRLAAGSIAVLLSCAIVVASPMCPDEQKTKQLPTNLALCKELAPIVRKPSAAIKELNVYEDALGKYLGNFCHRDLEGGWKMDKHIRNTGPYIANYGTNRQWSGSGNGTHAPVLIWYSPDMYAWLKENRPEDRPPPAQPAPIPDGAMMIKEMYPYPASVCGEFDPIMLKPISQGATVMIRDAQAAHDGWFWGWFGWTGWSVDWPADQTSNSLPGMGFGQYCLNCHGSAKDHQTFAALKNIKGEPGIPLVFLSQDFFIDPNQESLHKRVQQSQARAKPKSPEYDKEFLKIYWSWGAPPTKETVVPMPSQTYDNVWVKGGGPVTVHNQFVTSDQCLGCHSAGSTGLQYDMTAPANSTQLLNFAPYPMWGASPMGLAGRDPIFFAQLASEIETFHPKAAAMVQDTCLGCHGIIGQRQFGIDTFTKGGKCEQFTREMVNAAPMPLGNKQAPLANFGALARDGISCTACHHMVLGKEDIDKNQKGPQNHCVEERQALLNPDLTGFAKTFTGSFFVGPPDHLYGPFKDPKKTAMRHAIGITPEHNKNVQSSELCGSCHTVHLPIMRDNETIGHTYEQTTYPEWAFSAYRTGDSPDGPLPYGPGPLAQSCQGCHMPNKDDSGAPNRSRIASIQEYSNFPQAEHTAPPHEIDLQIRSGFAKHTLVGLNIFFLKMAYQFYDILGIRQSDPMLGSFGIDPLVTAQNAMIDQATHRTAAVTVTDVKTDSSTLQARVTVSNRTGHKFPSGVGFRRVLVEFSVLDANKKVLWASGRTDSMGVIIDDKGNSIPGEFWWTPDCSARINPTARIHQPHYELITRQDQAQIYEELVSTPPAGPNPVCGPRAEPQGMLTTSFLSICAKVKDNRLLPQGFLPLEQRIQIARALGAKPDLAEESGPSKVGTDPEYLIGGADTLVYRVPLTELNGKPAAVEAKIYFQATPPYFLQDRFCTSKSEDTKRLYYLAGNLNLKRTRADNWKFSIVTSGPVTVP